MPKLRLRYRILLYFSMILFATLALINVALSCFSDVVGIIIYVLAAFTLFSGAYYLVFDLRNGFRGFKEVLQPKLMANQYVNKVASDYRLRTVVLSVPGAMSNILFSLFNGVLGIMLHSAWCGSLAAYYILLSIMRVGAVREEREISKIRGEEHLKREIKVYRTNSILLVFMAIVLAGMVVLLEVSQGGKEYPGFTIYVAAMFAFYKIITSSIHVIKIGKQKSPLLSIIKRIGYVDACVSILTLQTAMFASFADGQETFTKLMNGITGGVVCTMVLFVGIQGIVLSVKMQDNQNKLQVNQNKMGGNLYDSYTCSRR